MDAVILAAASLKSRQLFGGNKALSKYGDVSLVQRAVAAARAARFVGKVYLVGDAAELAGQAGGVDGLVPPVGGPLANLHTCIEQFGLTGELLVLSSDLPLLTASALEEFAQICAARGQNCQMYYPIMTRQRFCSLVHGYPKTFIRVKDGSFTSGSGFIVDVEMFLRNREYAEGVAAQRKSPLKMARLMGGMNLLKFVLGQISLRDIEKLVSRKGDCCFQIVELTHPGLIVDVDRPQQLRLLPLGGQPGTAREYSNS